MSFYICYFVNYLMMNDIEITYTYHPHNNLMLSMAMMGWMTKDMLSMCDIISDQIFWQYINKIFA